MRKIKLLSTGLVIATAMLGVLAGSAQAINHDQYEWCHENRTCFGVVTVLKSSGSWSYAVGGFEEFGGRISKSAMVWDFKYENADAEACELRMTKSRHAKSHHNLVGAEYCGGNEIETAEWKRL